LTFTGGYWHLVECRLPVRRIPRRRLKGLANDLGDLVIAALARRVGTGLVIETRHPMFGETAAAIFLRC
jgi:hypothetical protein